GVDVIGDDVGLDDGGLADLEIGDALTEGGDRSREFVTHCHRSRFPGDRVRMAGRWDEDRPLEILMQVGAADSAPCDIDLDCAREQFGFGDVFDPDVLAVVEACCAHDSSFETVESRGSADPDGTSVVYHSGSFDHSTTQ